MPLGQYLGAGSAVTQGLYRLEDTSDASGNARTLTNTGTTTFTAARFANGANFGTSNSTKRLSVTNNMGVTGGVITMNTWVKVLTEIASGIYVFLYQSSVTNNNNYQIEYDYNAGTRRLIFTRGKINTADQPTYYTITLGTSLWYCLTLVYDNTNVMGYVNGNQVSSGAASGAGASGGVNLFSIGANSTPGNWASSIQDETFIENRAWSASDVRKYYTFAVGRFR